MVTFEMSEEHFSLLSLPAELFVFSSYRDAPRKCAFRVLDLLMDVNRAVERRLILTQNPQVKK